MSEKDERPFDDLEDRLREGPRPRDEFVDGIVRRAGRRPASRRGPALSAAVITGALVLGLGVTGGLGAAGSAVGDTADAIRGVFVVTDTPPPTSDKGVKPADDQYGNPGKGCGKDDESSLQGNVTTDPKDPKDPCPVPGKPGDDGQPTVAGEPPSNPVPTTAAPTPPPATGGTTTTPAPAKVVTVTVSRTTARNVAKRAVAKRFKNFSKRVSTTTKCSPAGNARWRCTVTWRVGKTVRSAVVIVKPNAKGVAKASVSAPKKAGVIALPPL